MVPKNQEEAWEESLGLPLKGQGWDVVGIDLYGLPIPCRPSETSNSVGHRTVRGVCVSACVYLSLVEMETPQGQSESPRKLVAGTCWKPGQALPWPVREERLLWRWEPCRASSQLRCRSPRTPNL